MSTCLLFFTILFTLCCASFRENFCDSDSLLPVISLYFAGVSAINSFIVIPAKGEGFTTSVHGYSVNIFGVNVVMNAEETGEIKIATKKRMLNLRMGFMVEVLV